jgi:Regulator of chromosome condensation (RCC1) repeat
MTDHGTVYSWGDGKRGQLGHGDVSLQAAPKVVDALKRKVAAIAAGSFHSVFLLAAGSVYVCGSGRQLGLGVFTGNGDQSSPQVWLCAVIPSCVGKSVGCVPVVSTSPSKHCLRNESSQLLQLLGSPWP